jgi:abhydrolase domain-containing protein 12
VDGPIIANRDQNAGTVAQGWRTDSYRSLSGGSSSNIHILAIDYRGFGLSTGFPTEKGVIVDAITTIEWAMKIGKVPSERIVILGQSLGTGVTSAVAEHFAKQGVDFAGIVLVAGFTSIPNLVTQYSIGGQLPLLSPFKRSRWFARSLETYVADKWVSTARLANVVRLGKRVRVFIVASKNDGDIPWTESEGLFAAAANATTNGGMSIDLFKSMKARKTIDMGDGAFTSTWNAGGDKIIREDIVLYGRAYFVLPICHTP